MKKSIFALGLMFAALTLTNCTKNEEENIVPETKGQAFELFANADTRTTFDGVATSWAADDALNVFHAVAGTDEYKNDGSFSIAKTDLASGRFTGALSGALKDGATYDWYLFYPYKSQITTPANTSGYTQIGQRSDQTQTQTDKDNMAHVAGSNYPLYGQATVKKGEAVNVTMQHIASLIAVNVTNNAAEDIKVSKISFVAPEKIVGAYYIDFSGKSIIYKEHTTDSFTSATATLEVTGDATIAAGQSAKFYLGIKPFTAAEGGTLTITVSTDKGDCVKTLKLPKATTFTAGRIKTLNFEFVAPEEDPNFVQWIRVTNIADVTAGDYVIVGIGDKCGYLADENTAQTPAYKNITLSSDQNQIESVVSNNMIWNFSGTTDAMTIKSTHYLVNSSKTQLSTNKTTVSDNDTWKISATTSGKTFYLQSKNNSRYLAVYSNQDWRCYLNQGENNSNCKITLYKKQSVDPSILPPTLTLTPDSDITLAGNDKNVYNTIIKLDTNTTNIEVGAYEDDNATTESDWLIASYENGYVVYCAVSNNEDNNARIAFIVVKATNENGTTSRVIKVTQKSNVSTTTPIIFSENSEFQKWSAGSYSSRELGYDDVVVKFSDASKQSSTITDCPVTKQGTVEIVMKNNAILTGVKVVLKQWGTKKKTVSLHYSIDGGESYKETGVSSSNFTLEKLDLPSNTNALRITQGDTSNQVGWVSVELTYLK